MTLLMDVAGRLPVDKRRVLLERVTADLERRGNFDDADLMNALARQRDAKLHKAAQAIGDSYGMLRPEDYLI